MIALAMAIQIHYAVLAFRKGWRFRALLPLGFSFLLSMVFGFTGGGLEGGPSLWPVLLAWQVITIFGLRDMANTAPADYKLVLPSAIDVWWV